MGPELAIFNATKSIWWHCHTNASIMHIIVVTLLLTLQYAVLESFIFC